MKFKLLTPLLLCLLLTGCSKNMSKTQDKIVNEDYAISPTIPTTITLPSTTVSSNTTTTIKTTEATTTTSTEPVTINSDVTTYVASTMTIEIPNNWQHTGTRNIQDRPHPATLHFFKCGELSVILEEVDVTGSLSDTEIFDTTTEQRFKEPTCENVEIYELESLRYSKSYYSGESDFHIYSFVHDGYLYQLDITGFSLLPDGDNTVINILNSIQFTSLDS